jgi:hypothetical protein
MYFYRFYLSLPVSARNGVAGGRRPSSSSLLRRVVGRSDSPRRNHGLRTQKWSFKRPLKGYPVQPTTRYPTPVINCVDDFSSLREAGLKGGKGLLGSVTRHYSDLCGKLKCTKVFSQAGLSPTVPEPRGAS